MNACLSNGSLHVSYVLTGSAGDQACARLLPQLTPEDRARAARFLLVKDQLAFCVGRVLVRRLLSQYAPEPAGGWRIAQNEFGKPALVPTPGLPDIRFNISHSTGVVAVAISLDREIGVDVESVEHQVDFLDIARSQFSFVEVELLESLSKQSQRDAFFTLWTLKEAYAKARGAGLSLSLSDFAFTLDPPTICFSPQLAEDPRAWFFMHDHLSPTLQLAVAARRRPDERLAFSRHEVPLTQLF
jgi:4'-phosphopantetheinyl transferase